MAKYGIPTQLSNGFKKIISLNPKEIQTLSDSLKNGKRGEGMKTTANNLAIHFPYLNKGELEELSIALFSIANTFYSTEDSIENFIEDFSNSLNSAISGISDEDLQRFKSNIVTLIPSFDNSVKKTIKARDISTENPRSFSTARIISDIRIVFDDNHELEQADQDAVIVHNLKIGYFSVNRPNEFYVSLDITDLNNLQKVIARAIEKDKLIRTNNHSLTFIDLN